MTKKERKEIYKKYEEFKVAHGKELALVLPAKLWDNIKQAREEDFRETMEEIKKSTIK